MFDDKECDMQVNDCNKQEEVDIDSEDEVENDNPENIKEELILRKSLNTSTCLYPKEGPSIKTNEILNIAPGEGQVPTHIFYEKDWEALAFPYLFPSGANTFNVSRETKLTAKKYINARLLSSDKRFSESTEYIFQCLHWSETIDVKNSITMQLKKNTHQRFQCGKIKKMQYICNH